MFWEDASSEIPKKEEKKLDQMLPLGGGANERFI